VGDRLQAAALVESQEAAVHLRLDQLCDYAHYLNSTKPASVLGLVLGYRTRQSEAALACWIMCVA
jgi:hypothetical protein